ncbi:MAG: hypothetical protein QNJ38_19820 [Prochloraceae cyanobacterium]|nr:hypothetical protein [Prochloraceae cyanobacterium]
MSDRELKNYFLAHRHDSEALSIYLERRKQNKPEVIAHVDDPDFDEKMAAAITTQLNQNKLGDLND